MSFSLSRGRCKRALFHGRCFSEGSLLGGIISSPRGRMNRCEACHYTKFHKSGTTAASRSPCAEALEPLSCPSAGHAAPQLRSAFGSRRRWPARPATAFGIPDEYTWVGPGSWHSRRPLGASGLAGAGRGFGSGGGGGGRRRRFHSHHWRRGQALEPPFCAAALLAHHRLAAPAAAGTRKLQPA